MSNMSNCMFENTYKDLLDCYERMNDECDITDFLYGTLSESERNYAKKLIRLCQRVNDEIDLEEAF